MHLPAMRVLPTDYPVFIPDKMRIAAKPPPGGRPHWHTKHSGCKEWTRDKGKPQPLWFGYPKEVSDHEGQEEEKRLTVRRDFPAMREL